MPDFNDPAKLGDGKERVERLTNLIAIFENPALDFSKNRADGDDLLGDAYEYLMRHFATESGKSKGPFYTPAEVSRIIAQNLGIRHAKMLGALDRLIAKTRELKQGVRRTTRIESGLAGVGSLAETIDPLHVTQSLGTSPAFDRQTRQPRSHYFVPESVRSCGANEKLRVRRPRQRLRSGSSPWFWRKPVS